MLRIALALLLSLQISDGFLQLPKPEANLIDFAKTLQKVTQLDIRLQVDSKDVDKPAFYLQGLKLVLGEGFVNTRKILMPGFHGPYPSVSSGLREIQIQAQGFFVDIFGMKRVPMNDGCWELVWRDGDMHGSLICGIDVPESAERNGAVFPKGKIYLSFPVWTPEGLATQQALKFEVAKRAEEYLRERDEELAKMQETSNPLSKIWHYRNAADALERYFITGYRRLKDRVPDSNGLMELAGGLLMNKRGYLWTKRDRHQVVLGSAHLVEQPKPVTE